MSFGSLSTRQSLRLLLTLPVMLALLLAALPASAEPLTVTTVAVNSPTAAAKAYVSAGNTFTVNYTVTSNTGGSGQAKFYLGATLIKTVSVTLATPTTALSEVVTVPGGTVENLYDVMVEVKEDPQSNWVQGIQHDAVVVDNTAPTVPAAVVTSPNGGEFWAIGTGHNITWDRLAIADANLAANPIRLYYSVDGGATWLPIASGEANDGIYPWTVPGPTTTQARVKVEAVDKAGNAASDTSNANFTIHAVDPTPPTVTLTAPPDNAKIRGSYTATATAADPDTGIAQVAFFYSTDGATWPSIGVDLTAPFEAAWNTAALPDGTTVWVKAVARNGVGAETEDINAGIVIDNSAPTVGLTAPLEAAFVHGAVDVAANAADAHSGIATVLFQYKPAAGVWADIGADATAPFGVAWNTVPRPDGAYQLRAVARNGSGLETTSAVVNVTVDNTPPAKTEQFLLAPNGGEVWQIGTTRQITWDPTHIADVNLAANPISLFYRYDGTWYPLAANEANDGSFSWALSGLLSDTGYRVKIVVVDRAGNATEDISNGDFTIWAQDSTGPLVALTAPANGALVKDAVTLSANASDPESGVAYVEFWYRAGGGWVKLSEDWWTPYEASWNTIGLPDGAAQLKAVAKNGVGMATESALVNVVIDNSLPAVTLIEPEDGTHVFGYEQLIVAEAADPTTGIASVAFHYRQHGGAAWVLLATDATDPYRIIWDTTTAPDGPGYIRATACNGVGLCAEHIHSIMVTNEFTINLRPGWNMISLPLIPFDADIADVLGDLIAHHSVLQVRAWMWEGGALVEKMWAPVGPHTLNQMKDGQGYWIQMADYDTLTVNGTPMPPPPMLPPAYAVHVGWNHIGFTSLAPQGLAGYLGPDLAAAAASLYGYDAASGLYFIPTSFEPSLGYWLGSTAAGVIYP